MSKPKKRTISELMKQRKPGSRSQGIDLLEEGRNIMESSRKHSPTLLESDVPEFDVSRSDVSISDISKAGMSKSDVSVSGISESDVSSSGISKAGMSKSDISNSGISKSDVSNSGISKSSMTRSESSSSVLDTSLATRIYYEKAKEESALLRSSNSMFSMETKVVDTVFAKLKNPAASVVFVYLWRMTIGKGKETAKISANVIGESVGMNRRTALLALRELNKVGLVCSEGLGEPKVAEHRVLKTWSA